MYKKRNTFPYEGTMSNVITSLLQPVVAPKLTNDERDFLNRVQKYGQATKHITLQQMVTIGEIWKQHVNNGKFVKHDWWPGKNTHKLLKG